MNTSIRSLLAGRRGPEAAPSPPLTSMVDMMTILVVFMLVNFSVEGEIATAAHGVRLPESTARQRARPELNVTVAPDGVSIDGVPVATIDQVLDRPDLLIAPLAEALDGRFAAVDSLPALTIQCDRGIDFRVLKRVVHTCGRAGGTDFELLVLREES